MLTAEQRIEMACGKVAETVFPHHQDFGRQAKLADALAALCKQIVAAAIEESEARSLRRTHRPRIRR